jgi:hypothetical protein
LIIGNLLFTNNFQQVKEHTSLFPCPIYNIIAVSILFLFYLLFVISYEGLIERERETRKETEVKENNNSNNSSKDWLL